MIVVTSKGNFLIREAIKDDLPALVHIHVTSWNATYPDYHPKPTSALRESQWRKAFELREGNWFCYVVAKDNDDLVGFATGNDFDGGELNYDAQLNKIHFLKDYHRLGLGRKLVGVAVERFLHQGKDSMILFADPGNENIAFYDMLGGERILDKNGKFQGAFGWTDLHQLLVRCNE